MPTPILVLKPPGKEARLERASLLTLVTIFKIHDHCIGRRPRSLADQVGAMTRREEHRRNRVHHRFPALLLPGQGGREFIVTVMGSIMTVTGEVPSDEIGAVLMHEHILCDFHRITNALDHLLDDIELVTTELGHLDATSVRTVVEMTSVGLGRDLKSMRDIALRTGLNIVAGCGWYRDPFLPQEVFETTSDGLADILISEINEGAGDGGVRPGIIGEIGAKRSPMSPAEERVLRAGGFAQLQTGVSIYTHASRSTVGIDQAKILLSIGVPPERIVIGHADTVPPEGVLVAVARYGCHPRLRHGKAWLPI